MLRVICWAGACTGLLAILAAATWLAAQPALTQFVESESFREKMDQETSKGMHFTGHYDELNRTGTLVVEAPRFVADNGFKTIVSLDARKIRGAFNPWGILLRRWQFDQIDIETAKVGIHRYEPIPETQPARPWYAVFLPNRVYLKKVVAAHADVEWRLRGEISGFRDTRLVVTPNGRDFEYSASGGTFHLPGVPDMDTESLHMLVTKDQLTLYDLELSPAGSKEGRLSMHAHAGLKEDKRIDGELAFERIPVASWIPKSWDGRFHGQAKGRVRWEGESAKLETSRGEGDVRMDGLRYADANILQQLATATGREELRTLHFEMFHTSVKWKYPNVEIYDLEIEARGVLRVEGRITINSHKLGGKIELGVRAEYLAWLPKATEEIFTRSRDGYHWTTVHFSGTLGQPREDLSERVRETIKESPGAMLGLWFREAGAWLDRAFGG